MNMIGPAAAEREVIESARKAAKWLPPLGFQKGSKGWEECQRLAAAVRRLRAEERALEIAVNAHAARRSSREDGR